ncbi:MAG: zinc ribbon domain-containing protein [Candidatus Thorarchaeota archaeon]
MTQDVQCQSWKQGQRVKSKPKHKSMTGKYISGSSRTSYLVESFSLNSVERIVSRSGQGRQPDPTYRRDRKQISQLVSILRGSGKKVKSIDLETLTLHFDNYTQAVNLLLSRIYSSPSRVEQLGKVLAEYRGRAYTRLMKERDLCYEHNEDIKKLVYGRLHRNVLEQVGRMLLADWTRRQLFTAALKYLETSPQDTLTLLRRKRIPSFLIRKVRDSCDSTKNNGAGYHYAMGVLRQVRLAIDRHVLDTLGLKIGWRARQRKKVASLLKDNSVEHDSIVDMVTKLIEQWVKKGYPFSTPQLRSYSLDFSASTENSLGQGYWFTLDNERENEILMHLKLPPGIDGAPHDDSPYKGRTLTFRFLDWLPRAANKDRRKAEIAREKREQNRAESMTFRAAKFEDMHTQFMNTIQFQHSALKLARLKQRKGSNPEKIIQIQEQVKALKSSRRSAPPRLLLRGQRVTLQIPFLSPNGSVSSGVFGDRAYSTKAGVDRGLRAPVALSVEKEQSYNDLLITVGNLVEKREGIRKFVSSLTSEVTLKKNNWDKKRSGQSYPTQILRQDRQIAASWRKIRRLDREIARQVASRTVWFCEEHRVKKLFFEDLRSFQAHAGSRDLSYNLSSNLWGKIIDTVRYMRESLGHSKYSVWTVNPRYTSQTCHVCGERGVRVENEASTTERKGGEYFYCQKCDEHFHADINAARNIIHVQDSSVVPGRTKGSGPSLSTLQ